MLLSPHDVHAHKHAGPVAALGTACPGIDLDHAAQRIFFAAKHVLELEFLQFFKRDLELLFGLFGAGLTGLVEFVQRAKIVRLPRQFGKRSGPVFFKFYFAQDYFRFPGIIPEIGC